MLIVLLTGLAVFVSPFVARLGYLIGDDIGNWLEQYLPSLDDPKPMTEQEERNFRTGVTIAGAVVATAATLVAVCYECYALAILFALFGGIVPMVALLALVVIICLVVGLFRLVRGYTVNPMNKLDEAYVAVKKTLVKPAGTPDAKADDGPGIRPA